MPIVFFYFIGTVTRGSSRPSETKQPLAVRIPPDAGFLAERLVRRLEARDYRVVPARNQQEFLRHIRRLTVPPGFTATVLAGLIVIAKDGKPAAPEDFSKLIGQPRLASSPMSRRAVVLRKWGPRVALGDVQIAFAMLTGTLLVLAAG